MRLLIFGAGVLGTFYAAKLRACRHDVTVLARGRRAAQVRDDGLVVQERGRGCLRARASVIETPATDQSFDYVLVLVQWASRVGSAITRSEPGDTQHRVHVQRPGRAAASD